MATNNDKVVIPIEFCSSAAELSEFYRKNPTAGQSAVRILSSRSDLYEPHKSALERILDKLASRNK